LQKPFFLRNFVVQIFNPKTHKTMNYFFKRLRFWKLMALLAGVAVVTQSCDSDEKDPPYTPEPPQPENVVKKFNLFDVIPDNQLTAARPEGTPNRSDFIYALGNMLEDDAVKNIILKQDPDFDFNSMFFGDPSIATQRTRSTSAIRGVEIFLEEVSSTRIIPTGDLRLIYKNDALVERADALGFDELVLVNIHGNPANTKK